MPFEKKPDDIGALWTKSGNRGEWMSGTINGVNVVCFRNDRKQPGDKQPDWHVLKAKPRDEVSAVKRRDEAPTRAAHDANVDDFSFD